DHQELIGRHHQSVRIGRGSSTEPRVLRHEQPGEKQAKGDDAGEQSNHGPTERLLPGIVEKIEAKARSKKVSDERSPRRVAMRVTPSCTTSRMRLATPL